MISAYCLDYNTWVCIPHHVREDFAELADMGIDTVCLSFSENDMAYARRTFEILVDLAHEAGLKVFIIPSRIAGRFAGAPLMPSIWLAKHPQFMLPDECWLPAGCVECTEVRDFVCGFMDTLITDYAIDGIVWDEPKEVTTVSHHPATLARFGQNPTKEDMAASFCEFFEELTGFCYGLNPGLTQTLFCQYTEEEYFTRMISKNPHITYFGYDGNLSRQRVFKEEIAPAKYRIESAWDRTVSECAAAGKKTFALVESMCMPREEHKNFALAFDNFLTNYHPDHLSIYYYPHNADDPEGLNSIIKRTMKKHFKRS